MATNIVKRACCRLNQSLLQRNLLTGALPAIAGTRSYKQHKIHVDRELYKRRLIAGPIEEKPRSSQLNWNYDVELSAFGNRVTQGKGLSSTGLKLAFIDKSHDVRMRALVSEISGSESDQNNDLEAYNNEIIAEQGMQLCRRYVTTYLREHLPNLPDDGVKALTDFLMADSKLSYIASRLGVIELILCETFPVPEDVVAKSLLSVISVIHYEKGEEEAHSFVRDFILTQLHGEDLDTIYHIEHPMTKLSLILSGQGRGEPEPRLLGQQGHSTVVSCYTVGIYCDKKLIGKSPGETPEIAEQMAAQDALLTIYGIQDNRKPLDFTQTYKQKSIEQQTTQQQIAGS